MRHTAIAALSLSLAVTVASADVYRSVDAQGHVQYSDTPSPGAELVHVQHSATAPTSFTPAAASNAAPPPRSASLTPAQTLARGNAQAQDDITRQQAERAMQQDLEKTRADQCKKATDDYQASVAARRIYRTGADGQHEYLTDEEADQQRLSLRMAMQTACGSSSP